MDVDALVRRLAELPNVVAVTLGGSRASGRHRPDSDWDFGLYYRGGFDAGALRALGYDGTVVEPGEWGRFVNGGAWLVVDGERVDVLYRDLDVVAHWTDEARAGRYEVDRTFGYVAGMASYVLAGELALCDILHGELPRPPFPDALRRSAPPRWRALRDFSLDVAEGRARARDVAPLVGLAATAVLAEAQARLAERAEWALNEKGITDRAGLGDAAAALRDVGPDADALHRCVERVRATLGG